MALTLELPGEYSYVLLVAASSFFLNTYHVLLTSGARKRSGLKYPIAYAEAELAAKDPKAYAFNCTQRAHANFTETHTSFLGALLISGIQYPVVSAGLGAVWLLGRAAYAAGYAKGGPKGRQFGSIPATLALFPLQVMAVYSAAKMALALH